MLVEVPEEKMKNLEADSRGRVTIGSKFAGKKVVIGILEVKEESEE